MAPDFDFWDRDEPIEKTKNTNMSNHIHIKDLFFKKWDSQGTFVIRSEDDKFIITISTEDGIYAIIKVPAASIDAWSSVAGKLLEESKSDKQS